MDRPRPTSTASPQGGFTMVELVMIMMIVGILAVYALPKFAAAISVQDDTWREDVAAALRYAQKGAVARRRLTCVTITATTVAITAAKVNPATVAGCTDPIQGPDGSDTFATAGNSAAGTSVSPPGVIYFQPDGRVTALSASTSASSTRTISMTGASNIVVLGETGNVQ